MASRGLHNRASGSDWKGSDMLDLERLKAEIRRKAAVLAPAAVAMIAAYAADPWEAGVSMLACAVWIGGAVAARPVQGRSEVMLTAAGACLACAAVAVAFRAGDFSAAARVSVWAAARAYAPIGAGVAAFAVMGASFAGWMFRRELFGARRARVGVYGESDWASPRQVRAVFGAAEGFVVGEDYRVDLDKSGGEIFDPAAPATWGRGGRAPLLCFDGGRGSGHSLIFAGSGGFKTTSTVIPTGLLWPGNLVVLDPSKEVAPIVAAARAKKKRRVVLIDDEKGKEGFNALGWLKKSKNPEADVTTVAGWLMTERPGHSSGSEDFFRIQARILLAGVIAHVLFDDELIINAVPAPPEGEYQGSPDWSLDNKALAGIDQVPDGRSLRTVRRIITCPEPVLQKELEAIVKGRSGYGATKNPFVRETLGSFLNMTGQTFSGVYAQAAKETHWLSNPRFAALVCGADFDPEWLVKGRADIFVNIGLKRLQEEPGMGRCILGALLNTVYEADGQIDGRVLFLLDEANLLGYMRIIETARDAGRKYGITLSMIYQSVGQMADIWGRDAAAKWFESVSFTAFAGVKDFKTAEWVSDLAGVYTVRVRSDNASIGAWASGSAPRAGVNFTNQRRKLIEPHEVMQARADEQFIFAGSSPPMRLGRAIYFRRPELLALCGENRFVKSK